MNTSKQAEKDAAKQKINDENFNNPPELTEQENEQMQNNFPAEIPESPLDEIFEKLEDKKTEMRELTANYIDLASFKEGEERAFICTGKTTFTTQNGEVKPAVTLVDRERNTWICASTVIVNSLFKVEKFPVGCKIKVLGKEKGKNGDYYKAQVFVL